LPWLIVNRRNATAITQQAAPATTACVRADQFTCAAFMVSIIHFHIFTKVMRQRGHMLQSEAVPVNRKPFGRFRIQLVRITTGMNTMQPNLTRQSRKNRGMLLARREIER
jgi:hypothetical protein